MELLHSIGKFISQIKTFQLLYSEPLTISLLFLLQVLHLYIKYTLINAILVNNYDMYQQTLLKFPYMSILDVKISKVTLYSKATGTHAMTTETIARLLGLKLLHVLSLFSSAFKRGPMELHLGTSPDCLGEPGEAALSA